MKLRHTIARWLAPETFKAADRHEDLLATIDHEHRWLSEFPDIAEALDRLRSANPTPVAQFRGELRGLAMRRIVLARRGMSADLALSPNLFSRSVVAQLADALRDGHKLPTG